MGAIGSILGISASATTVNIGDPITFTCPTKNNSGYNRDFRYVIEENGTEIYFSDAFGIYSGQTESLSFTFPGFSTEGAHTLIFKLQAKDVTITPTGISLMATNTTASILDPIQFKAVVKDQAGKPMPDVYLWVVVDDQLMSSSSLPAPGTDTNGEKTFNITVNTPGTHRIKVFDQRFSPYQYSNEVSVNVFYAGDTLNVSFYPRSQLSYSLVDPAGNSVWGGGYDPNNPPSSKSIRAGIAYKLKASGYFGNPVAIDMSTSYLNGSPVGNPHAFKIKVNGVLTPGGYPGWMENSLATLEGQMNTFPDYVFDSTNANASCTIATIEFVAINTPVSITLSNAPPKVFPSGDKTYGYYANITNDSGKVITYTIHKRIVESNDPNMRVPFDYQDEFVGTSRYNDGRIQGTNLFQNAASTPEYYYGYYAIYRVWWTVSTIDGTFDTNRVDVRMDY